MTDRRSSTVHVVPVRLSLTLRAVLLACLVSSGCAREDDYPSRPIELICPWSAGGGTDRIARQIAFQLQRELGTPVNVINATGGNGVVGHTRGALASPNGYTLTLVTVELNMLHWRGLTTLGPQEFQPLCLLNRDDAAIFVREDSPFRTTADLETALRTAAVPLKASGTSLGGVWHVAAIGWLASQGISPGQLTWISIGGSTPSLQELIAGGVDFVCCSVAEASALLDAGKIRCLGVMGSESSSEIPTFRDAGIAWEMGGWRGIAAPVGLDPQRQEKLCTALNNIFHSEEFTNFMDQAGFNRTYADADTFADLLQTWDEDFGRILNQDALRSSQQARFGPMFFPMLIGAGLLSVFTLLLLTGGLRPAAGIPPIDLGVLVRLSIVPIWVAGYVLISPWAGFVVTVSILLVVTMLALQVRWTTAVPTTLIVVPVIYHLFAVVLHVSLPWGWIGW